MKKIFYILLVFNSMLCQAQKKYSNINFELFTETYKDTRYSNSSVSYSGFNLVNGYYKDLGDIDIYGYPKNKEAFKKYYDNREFFNKTVHDSLKKMYTQGKLLQQFEVFATWVDKKYVVWGKDMDGDTGKEYRFPYVPDDKEVEYSVYKLTAKGWLLMETAKTKEFGRCNYHLKYLERRFWTDSALKNRQRKGCE